MSRRVDRIAHLVPVQRAILFGALFLAGASAVFSVDVALAHHSSAPFDATREVVVLKGTVTRMEWTNPHVWIRLEVPDEEGNVVKWGVEATNPLALGRMGWTANTFRPGDHVTITVNPAKSGDPFGAFVSAILDDGTVLKKGALIDEAERDHGASE